MRLEVGDKVVALSSIYEPADEFGPAGYLCARGDILIVRKVIDNLHYPYSVSHEHITDQSFGVSYEEVDRVLL